MSIEEEINYMAQQTNPYTAIGGGLRFLCGLKGVEYSDNETDDVIRKKLLERMMGE